MKRTETSLLAALLLAAGCGQSPAPKPAAPEAKSGPAQTYRVEAAAERDFSWDVVTAPGKIEADPARVSKLYPPVSGRVTQVLVRFGDRVAAGQPVAVIESAEADAAVAAAAQAEAALRQSRAGLSKAEADLERMKDLHAHRAIARKELLGAENQEAQARGALEQAEAALRQSRRRLELLGLREGDYGKPITLRAPLPGKVLEVTVAAGEFRNDPNASLMTIADLGTVWVTADVAESAIRRVQRGERIETELAAYPGEIFPGRVTQISDVVDPTTRTVKVRAELPNPGGRLRPEMFGEIRHIDAVRRLPAVPFPAVVQVKGRAIVFVERAPGSYQERAVETGPRQGDLVPIASGLAPGERVVVDGAMLVSGGGAN